MKSPERLVQFQSPVLMITFRSFSRPTLEQAALIVNIDIEKLDKEFGVVRIDDSEYCVKLKA